MSNQFFILIDKNNEEKFRKFKLEKFNDDTKEILNDNSAKFVWGLHKGKVKSSLWSKLQKNDTIHFTTPEENFKISANFTWGFSSFSWTDFGIFILSIQNWGTIPNSFGWWFFAQL